MLKLRLRKFKTTQRTKIILITVLILLAAFFAANLDYPDFWNQFSDWTSKKVSWLNLPKFAQKDYSLGLDLQGGVHLVYEADLSQIKQDDRGNALSALRDAIERRVNFLGVSEPVVQIQEGATASKLIVELAGISDPALAIERIGQTPYLEFKEPRPIQDQARIIKKTIPDLGEPDISSFCSTQPVSNVLAVTSASGEDPCFQSTQLTGRYLERADVVSHPQTGEIQVSLQFNDEGGKLFADITERNIGGMVAIYLDQVPVSVPRVNEKITGGSAVVTGNFTLGEAKNLTSNLNSGALPVPIALVSQQRVGASLGEKSLNDSLFAGIVGVIVILTFLIVVYRFSGFVAVLSLGVYLAFLLLLIKFIPITLTLAGIAGLILSIGIAVDANVLVFERLREEMNEDVANITRSIDKAFSRAWPSVRDGNVSTFFTALILFLFSTSFIQGFALTLGIGILVSLFSGMVVTRVLMKSIAGGKLGTWKVIWSRKKSNW